MAAPLLKRVATMFSGLRTERGFSLAELMLTVAVAGTLMAMAVPIMQDVTAAARLNESVRLVERELQDARLRAVSANRSLRVRINCPTVGQLRTVEVLGTAADNSAGRCSTTAYPFPADQDLMTRPNYDGPLRVIPNAAEVTTKDIQFMPDGTAQLVNGGAAQPIVSVESIVVERQGVSRTVTVNGAGKVQLQIQQQ